MKRFTNTSNANGQSKGQVPPHLWVPDLNGLDYYVYDAILASGSKGMTTQDLRSYARNPTAAVTSLRDIGVNVVSIPLGTQYDPIMQRPVKNTVKYVIGIPRFIRPDGEKRQRPKKVTLH